MRLRGCIAGSFRTPSWTERYYEDLLNRGRADLQPERGWTTEVGADLQPLRDSWVSITAFRTKSLNLIDWARPEGAGEGVPWETRNVEAATFWGLEAEFRSTIGGADISLQGNVLRLDSEAVEGFTSKYALRPLVRHAALVAMRKLGPIGVALSARYSRREGDPGYWLLDWRATVPAAVGELYLDVRNGLSEEYDAIPGVPAAGRSVVVGLRTGYRG